MSRTLSGAEARVAFEELATALPKQHLRLQFRKRFGGGEVIDPKVFKRGTAEIALNRAVANLLQEVPEKLVCTRITGTAAEPQGQEWTAPADGNIGTLIGEIGGEQGLMVQGRKARLYIYVPNAVETVNVLRITTELFGEEKKPPAKPSRKVRANAGKPGRATARPKGTRSGGRR